jgi:heme a synthase
MVQVALGGWVSSNYAAIACPGFPGCGNPVVPDFAAGFSWHGLGPDYQGGILTDAARAAIHLTHRFGALVVFLLLGAASLMTLLKAKSSRLRALGALVGLLLFTQLGLGISLVELGWPLPVADLHNGVAALLLGATVALNWSVWAGRLKP